MRKALRSSLPHNLGGDLDCSGRSSKYATNTHMVYTLFDPRITISFVSDRIEKKLNV